MSVVDPIRELQTPRLVRFVQFCGVGAAGMVVDLSLTFALLGQTHYLLANGIGWAVAVSSNFAGNWWLTYSRPDGNLRRQYVSYVGLHALTFGLRAAAIALLVEVAGAPPRVATIAGVGLAATANFIGTEGIFAGAGQLWFDAIEAANHIAHLAYNSQLRRLLQLTGLYNPIFLLYSRGLSVAYPAAERDITINGESASVVTEKPVETVSILHTLEKERDILADFVSEVQPDDHVLDVGSNLGVFSTLAGSAGATVTAVEPHPPTAKRCRANLQRNDVDGQVIEAALGDKFGTVQLSVQQDAVGTQRPEISNSGSVTVDILPADRIRAPDIVKIDVEGAEIDVLRGLEQTLRNQTPRAVYVECHGTTAAVERLLSESDYCVSTVAEREQTFLKGIAGCRDAGQRGSDARDDSSDDGENK